jgi:16S rRNA (guanine527-N7)-methyltransferase
VDQDSLLVEILEDAQRRGFLGPEPVVHHLDHSRALADAIGGSADKFLDLGSGAGVPGLALALAWPEAHGVLLDSQQRRCSFLERAIERLGLLDRLEVVCGRAEELARRPDLRGRFDLVVARAFGRPAVTAECSVGFLRGGGRLVVTEPPEGTSDLPERWPDDAVRRLGYEPATSLRSGTTGAVVLVTAGSVDERWPRRVGRPTKSPLW